MHHRKHSLVKKGARRKSGAPFWDSEYKDAEFLALSKNPSEDLLKFLRFLEREYGAAFLSKHSSVLDVGCGNGRNLIHLAQTFDISGVGIDLSKKALQEARVESQGLRLEYRQGSAADPLPAPAGSYDLVLDMMTSHALPEAARVNLRREIARVLKPGGWLFFKTFLREGDRHAERLIADYPAGEEGSYIHPTIGALEHVTTEQEIVETLSPLFTIHKITKSHRHLRAGRAFKRRSVSVYAEKRS